MCGPCANSLCRNRATSHTKAEISLSLEHKFPRAAHPRSHQCKSGRRATSSCHHHASGVSELSSDGMPVAASNLTPMPSAGEHPSISKSVDALTCACVQLGCKLKDSLKRYCATWGERTSDRILYRLETDVAAFCRWLGPSITSSTKCPE